jgi:hypothetical protein
MESGLISKMLEHAAANILRRCNLVKTPSTPLVLSQK